jgi:hypothetical protein
MKYIQVSLLRTDLNCNLVCWLEKDKRIKPGRVLTLKDTEGKWKVQEVYSLVELEQDELQKDWKVGGLQ